MEGELLGVVPALALAADAPAALEVVDDEQFVLGRLLEPVGVRSRAAATC